MFRRELKIDNARLIYLLLALIYFIHYLMTLSDWHFIDNVNLVIHEAGHTILFAPVFGQFINILGGSLFQVLLPLVFVIAFFLQKEFFSGWLVLFWVGQNLLNVSIYAADAQKMQLPLLGGDSVIHDWNFILTHLRVLNQTDAIASGLFIAGTVVLILAFLGSLFTTFSIERISSREI